jgi:hypothetical protein
MPGQPEEFDGYRKWLGISEKKRPPSIYELLSVALDEDDPDVIRAAAQQRRSFVDSKRGEGHDAIVKEILYRICEAETILLDPVMRRDYDRQLSLFSKRRRNRQVDPVAVRPRIESRPGPTVGEDSGFFRTFAGIFIAICAGFGLMLWLSSQSMSPKGVTRQPPAGAVDAPAAAAADPGPAEDNGRGAPPAAGDPVQDQLNRLRNQLAMWQQNQRKLRDLIASLNADRTQLLGRLDALTANDASQQNSSEFKVLANELRGVLRQIDAFGRKLNEYDLAILKTESLLRQIERQLAAADAGASEQDLSELAATVAAFEESLNKDAPVEESTDNPDEAITKLLSDFRQNRMQSANGAKPEEASRPAPSPPPPPVQPPVTAKSAAPAPPAPPAPPATTAPQDLKGFVPLFNGRDLTGWQGKIGDPPAIARMSPAQLRSAQRAANESAKAHWQVSNGGLIYDGGGTSLVTARNYRNFELLLDWKIRANGDSGIYLRGCPQVQIWDPGKKEANGIGSGGLYNNKRGPSLPIVRADRPVGEWNTMRIRLIGQTVSVWLNGTLVVDEVTMENYWYPDQPLFDEGPIELQHHGGVLEFRSLMIRELK